MRLTMHLVRKELRDARAVVVGTALATAVLAFVAAWFVRRFMGKGWTPEVTSTFLPLATGLGAALAGAAVAAESFAGDATSRRIEGAALLPVSLARVFAAKAVATATTWALAAAWTTTVVLLAVTAFGADLSKSGSDEVLWTVFASLPVVAAVALLACVLEHGLGAVLGAIVLVGGGGLTVVRFTPWEEWGLAPRPWDVLAATAPVTFVLVAAAWLAFVRGPIHLAWRVRRAALGLGTALVVLVGGGAAAAAVLDARVDVAPGDRHAEIGAMRVSPDGAYVVLIVGNRRAPVTSQAWSVRLADGAAVRIPGRYWMFHGWDGADRATLWEGDRKDRQRLDTIRTVDLATGAIRSTRSADQAAASWTDRWSRVHQAIGDLVVEWPERSVNRRLERAWATSASPRPGRICVWRNGGRSEVVDLAADTSHELPQGVLMGLQRWSADGRFLRLCVGLGTKSVWKEMDCETGAIRDLVPPSGPSGKPGKWGLFGDGPYATFHPDDRTTAVVDLRDGRVVSGPSANRRPTFVLGSDRHAVVFNGTEPTTLLDLSTGREAAIEPNPNSYGYPPNLIHAIPDGTFLVIRPGQGLDVIDADARTVRRVFPPAR